MRYCVSMRKGRMTVENSLPRAAVIRLLAPENAVLFTSLYI